MGGKSLEVAELEFKNCRVPRANLLGAENKGALHLMEGVQSERLTTTVNALTYCQLMIELIF